MIFAGTSGHTIYPSGGKLLSRAVNTLSKFFALDSPSRNWLLQNQHLNTAQQLLPRNAAHAYLHPEEDILGLQLVGRMRLNPRLDARHEEIHTI